MAFQTLIPIIRTARPDDAQAISRLYHDAYTPADGGDPRKCYPYPQFLEPELLASILKCDSIHWLVAEIDDKIVGTMGAIVNIGNQEDRIAECFGFVVDKDWRFQHLGSNLFRSLYDFLSTTGNAEFIIVEARTANSGGWKIVRHCDFIPLGLEPYAHKMPVGSESMLLTGKISVNALAQRNLSNNTSDQVYRLSLPILSSLGCIPLSINKNISAYSFSNNLAVSQLLLLDDGYELSLPELQDNTCHIDIYEEDAANGPPAKLSILARHKAGIVSLQRLEGKDTQGIRYQRKYFVAYLNKQPIAYVFVVWDLLDHRMRILDLRSHIDGIQGILIQHALEIVVAKIADTPLTVVVDIRADNVRLIATLETLGFSPTVYYPALIAEGAYRVDAVQFTRLYNLKYDECQGLVDLKEWALAFTLASKITIK
ncbi:GNAT family N-acetyltransferase [Methylomonas lenta]|uniref:GNAT family N-acetyltransferase n=1 Tax=Methylomonas lenta TaxID=980561 RepID=UPI000B0BAB13|nr:GNAT family N-acetyltransferase [Methylomonas lenta]